MRLLLATLAAFLAFGASAGAATYTVNACTGGGGSGVNRLFTPAGDAGGCAGGAGLFAHSYPVLAPYTYSSQVMAAPAGTTVAGYSMGWSVRWSTPVNGGYGAFIDGNDGVFLSWPCTFAGCGVGLPPSGPASTGWTQAERHGLTARALRLATVCGGSWCTSGFAEASWSDIYVELADPSAPSVSSGRLDGWVTGSRDVTWSASDNSGIRRGRLYLDDALRADAPRECDYSYAVPCRDASGSFRIDTAKLADGMHTFEVRALDATDANSGSGGSTAFLVDNHAPDTAAGGQGAPGAWQPGPVRVTLSARDAFSGASYVEWELDGAPSRRIDGDHADVTVAGDGTHTLTFRARDAAGNLSADRTVTVRLGTPQDRPGAPAAGFSDRRTNPASTFTAAPSF